MSVQTSERLSGKLEPTKNGSTYIDPKGLEWEKSQFEKIWKKVLYQNEAAGEMTVLLKFEPGAVLPFHKHPEIEQSWVLEGSLVDHEGACTAGNFVWRPAGSRHAAHAPNGALVLGFFLKPNKFF